MRTYNRSETWTCDRCGEDMMPRGYNIEVALLVITRRGYDALGNGAQGQRHTDLCQSCLGLLDRFLDKPERGEETP